jgi:hypothetical protein
MTGDATCSDSDPINASEERWESRAATEKVRAYYASVGFDRDTTLARLGVRAELGNFVVAGAPPEG